MEKTRPKKLLRYSAHLFQIPEPVLDTWKNFQHKQCNLFAMKTLHWRQLLQLFSFAAGPQGCEGLFAGGPAWGCFPHSALWASCMVTWTCSQVQRNGFVCSHLLLSDQMLFMEPFPCRTRHSNQFNAFVMSVYLPLDRDIWNSMSKPTATRRA